MRILLLPLMLLVGACSYTVTDDQRLNDIVARQNALEQRQSTLESRMNVQSEELGRLRRGLPYK